MLGIFFLYYIGKTFYELAENHNKSQWGFAIAGVVSYYASIFLGAFLLGLIFAELAPEMLSDFSDTAFGWMSIPFGLLGCWGFYTILKRQWEKEPSNDVDSNILDDNMLV